jgi:hypothetical protein
MGDSVTTLGYYLVPTRFLVSMVASKIGPRVMEMVYRGGMRYCTFPASPAFYYGSIFNDDLTVSSPPR